MTTIKPSSTMLALAVAVCLGTLVLAVVVAIHPGPLPGEVATVGWLQELGRPVPTIARFVRFTTGTEATLIVGALPAVWLVRHFGRRGVAAVAIALTSMLIAQPLLKIAVDRPRPAEPMVDVRGDNQSKSFPSGHSMSTATAWGAAAALTWRSGRRRWGAMAAAPIVVTALSSSVHGVHWPSDAVAGTALGAIAAGLMVHQIERDP